MLNSLHNWLIRKQVERFLGARLSKNIDDLHFYELRLDPDYLLNHAYIKFKASYADYLALMEQMGMEIWTSGDKPSVVSLVSPGHLKTPPGLEIPWWNPKLDLPIGIAARWDNHIRTVAKHENQYVYITFSRG